MPPPFCFSVEADNCFYRGGFFNWFEGGPGSPFVANGGLTPEDGAACTAAGRYCDENTNNKDFYPCAPGKAGETTFWVTWEGG